MSVLPRPRFRPRPAVRISVNVQDIIMMMMIIKNVLISIFLLLSLAFCCGVPYGVVSDSPFRVYVLVGAVYLVVSGFRGSAVFVGFLVCQVFRVVGILFALTRALGEGAPGVLAHLLVGLTGSFWNVLVLFCA